MICIWHRFLKRASIWTSCLAGILPLLDLSAEESAIQEIENPVLLKSDDLIIPLNLLHISHSWKNGRIMVRMNDKGEVIDWVPIDLPHHRLLPVLERCVSSLKFKPAMENGVPVDCDVELKIRFEEAIGISVSNQTIADHIESRYAALVPNRNRLTVSTSEHLDSPVLLLDKGYPINALDEHGNVLKGTISVEFYIDYDGRPRMLRIPDSQNRATEQAAYLTVSSLRFTPPRVHGKPTVLKVRMPVVLAGK